MPSPNDAVITLPRAESPSRQRIQPLTTPRAPPLGLEDQVITASRKSALTRLRIWVTCLRGGQHCAHPCGSKLYHATGPWPLLIRDETEVEAVEPDRRIILTARGWPLGEARIEIDLADDDGDCLVTMRETPTSGPGNASASVR
jgi:hypothetical protein